MHSMLEGFCQYNQVVNDRIFTLLSGSDAGKVTEASRLFSHILNAQHIWNARLQGMPARYMPGDVHSTEQMRAIADENNAKTAGILKTIDLNATIVYKNMKGQQFSNTAQDILLHMFNHATYHRGQIAMQLRASGVEPVVTDYIAFRRE